MCLQHLEELKPVGGIASLCVCVCVHSSVFYTTVISAACLKKLLAVCASSTFSLSDETPTTAPLGVHQHAAVCEREDRYANASAYSDISDTCGE